MGNQAVKRSKDFPVVVISKGKHSMEIPTGAQELLEEHLYASGFRSKDIFTVRIGKGVTATPHSPILNVKNKIPNTNSIIVETKPGDNQTRHQYYVPMPRGYRGTIDQFFERLRKGETQYLDELPLKRKIEKLTLAGHAEPNIEKASSDTRREPLPGVEAKKYRRVKDIVDDLVLATLLSEIILSTEGAEKFKFSNIIHTLDDQKLDCDSFQVLRYLMANGYIVKSPDEDEKTPYALTEKSHELILKEEEKEQEMTISNEAKIINGLKEKSEQYLAATRNLDGITTSILEVNKKINEAEQMISDLKAEKERLLEGLSDAQNAIPTELQEAHEKWEQISLILNK